MYKRQENDVEVARAYAECIKDEIDQLQKLGCERIQFDEPVLTESPDECTWAADVINDIVETFPNMYFSLHICGGNAHRKRGYFGKYDDMLEGLKNLKFMNFTLSIVHYIIICLMFLESMISKEIYLLVL